MAKPRTEEQDDREFAQAAGSAWKAMIVALVVGYLLDQVGEVASYDDGVTKKQVIAVARCLKRWAKNGFKRKHKP